MDADEAQRFADQWHAAAGRGATSIGFAASLQINPATLYNRRRKVEAALGIKLPTMTGAPHVAARERSKAMWAGALPELPGYTTAQEKVGQLGLTSALKPEAPVPCPQTADAFAIRESQIPNPGTVAPILGTADVPKCRQIPESADVSEQVKPEPLAPQRVAIEPVAEAATIVAEPATPADRPRVETVTAPSPRSQHRKHYIVPDMQLRPGVPMDHLPWIGADIVRRRPDVIVQIGDWWDMHSLSSHDEPGSLAKEGARYEDDIKVGMDGLELMMRPVLDAIAASDWRPRLIFTEGNHCHRIMRTVNADPRYAGTIGPHHCNVEKYGFERHNFLEVVTVDGISYSHYFQMAGSNRPIGGSMDNRLNKICGTFVQGHEQGLLQHRRPLPTGKTIHGLVCGSAYLHSEDYRGPQRNNEWRGTVVLHDVRNGGDCDPMPLTLQYMAREYGGVELHDLLAAKYPDLPRGWAA